LNEGRGKTQSNQKRDSVSAKDKCESTREELKTLRMHIGDRVVPASRGVDQAGTARRKRENGWKKRRHCVGGLVPALETGKVLHQAEGARERKGRNSPPGGRSTKLSLAGLIPAGRKGKSLILVQEDQRKGKLTGNEGVALRRGGGHRRKYISKPAIGVWRSITKGAT